MIEYLQHSCLRYQAFAEVGHGKMGLAIIYIVPNGSEIFIRCGVDAISVVDARVISSIVRLDCFPFIFKC